MPKLTDFSVLSFDVYGTLIEWETGILTALEPLTSKSTTTYTRAELLTKFHALENAQQSRTPDLPYSQLLATVHPQFAAELNLPNPSEEESTIFGNSVGAWPAFPDTVNALHRLKKYFKLVVLSNVDRDSFSRCNAGPLQGVPFDAVLTAQDIGSYKPDLRNFEYMLDHVHREFGVGREGVLQTAQSQFHDHHPAKSIGIKSVWIARPGATMGNIDKAVFDWKFDTLGEMADAVEQELGV